MVGDEVEVQIEDNGTGIEKNTMEKIFEPFFSGKPAGESTGLGLTLAADIVRAHGGTVRAESDIMQFTRMVVRLPIQQHVDVH